MAFICEVICSYIGLLVLLLIMISTTPLLLSYNVLPVQVHYIQLRTPCQVVPVGFHYKTINRSMEGFGCGGLSVSNGFVSAGTVFCSGEYSNASEPPFYRLRATSDFNTLEPPQTQDIVMEP
jgi:hypothetical protein